MEIACQDAVRRSSGQRDFAGDMPSAEPASRGNRQALADLRALVLPPLVVFLASRAICFLAGYLALIVFELPDKWRMAPDNLFIDWTSRWDSGWYDTIVQEGYGFIPGQQANVAFFPLYPLLIRSLSMGVVSPIVTALVADHLAFLGALIYFYALALRVLPDRASAERSLWLLALFPTSFFFSCYYTESLFLLVSVAAVYHLQRRQWGWAVLFAGLASASRVPGIFLYGVLMLEWLKDGGWTLATMFGAQAWRNLGRAARRQWGKLLLIQASVLGLAAYMTFLHLRFGRALLFMDVQAEWGKHRNGPWSVILHGISAFIHHDFWLGLQASGRRLDFMSDFNLLCLVGGLALGIVAWRTFGESYGCLCLISLLVPASTGGLVGIARYTGVVFPLFMALALKLRHAALERATLTIFTGLLAFFTAMFATWRFVA